MKKPLFGILFTLLTLSNVFASCQEVILNKISKAESKKEKQEIYIVSGAAVAAGVLLMYPAVGAGAFVILGSIYEGQNMKIRNLKRLSSVIEEAHAFRNTGFEGEYLAKLLKKVRRKTHQDITAEQLSDAIILSNETEQLCNVRGLSSYAKGIAVEL